MENRALRANKKPRGAGLLKKIARPSAQLAGAMALFGLQLMT
jgi:hypothetical protein